MFALLELVVVVVLVVLAVQYYRRQREGPDVPTASRRAPRGSLRRDLDRWVGAGLLTAEQEVAILDHEAAALPSTPIGVEARSEVTSEPATPVGRRPSSRVPVVAEAVGYLGGVLAVSGLALVLAHFWPDLALVGRLALTGGGALALWFGGRFVPEHEDPALTRLRAFLWLLSTAATAVFAGVLVAEADAGDQAVAFWCAVAVAVQSGLLWSWQARPAQQLTALGGAAVAVGSGVTLVAGEGLAGLVLLVLAGGYLTLGLTRRTPAPALTELVAAVSALAAGALVSTWQQAVGLPLLVAVGFALVALVTTPMLDLRTADRLAIGIPAGFGLLQAVPPTLAYFARDAGAATGAVVWVVGGLLIVVAARGLTRWPVPTEVLGGLAMVGGAALVGTQWATVAPVLGILTAVGLIGLGMLPGRVLLSLVGALGLLVNVPWAINELFPGEGRAPLLIMAAGAILVAVAVLLTRQGDRFRRDLTGPARHRVHRHLHHPA